MSDNDADRPPTTISRGLVEIDDPSPPLPDGHSTGWGLPGLALAYLIRRLVLDRLAALRLPEMHLKGSLRLPEMQWAASVRLDMGEVRPIPPPKGRRRPTHPPARVDARS